MWWVLALCTLSASVASALSCQLHISRLAEMRRQRIYQQSLLAQMAANGWSTSPPRTSQRSRESYYRIVMNRSTN